PSGHFYPTKIGRFHPTLNGPFRPTLTLHQNSASVCYDRMTQSIEAIDEGFRTGRVGTQEFQDAVYYIVPEHIYANASSGDERMILIHDYIDCQEFFADYFTVGEYGNMSIEFKNIVAFVEDCQAVDLFTGEDVSGFDLADSVTSIKSFSDAFDITDNVAIAMLYAVDTASYNWDESIVCEVLSKQSDIHFLP
ncbi:hypothetical protein JQM68_13515, partial [Oscillibacter valericigenes]|uniref:hypothetical protein n=1 Tax=Oscillibacter valericigenes TaxID=351091 RepID=UPI001F2A912A